MIDRKLVLKALKGLISLESDTSPYSRESLEVSKIFSDDQVTIDQGLQYLFVASFKRGNPQIASLALNAGVVISDSLRLKLGRTIKGSFLKHAMCDAELLKIALKFDGDVNKKMASGVSYLHLAAMSADPDVVEVFLEAKANPNHRSITGVTPVMLAAMRGEVEILELLVNAGGDPWIKNKNGKNSFHLAILNRKVKCIDYLKVLPKPENSFSRRLEFLRFLSWYYSFGYLDVEWKEKRRR